MKNVLIVIDVQNDFVDGALGTAEAQLMLPRLLKKLERFDGEVIFTQDTHADNYLSTQEGRFLPVKHCIKNTNGWELAPAVAAWAANNSHLIFKKPTFGSLSMADALKEHFDKSEIASVELVGLCTDICVVSNALLLKAAMPELTIKVDAQCCAGVTPAKHEAALEVMRSCQIIVTGEA